MTHHLLIAQFGNELLAIPSLRHIHGEEVALHRWGNMLEAINRWLDAWITWIRGEKFLMSRTFKTVDYDRALDLSVRLGDCLPPNHLARFVVDSVAQLDLSALYAHYGLRGGEPYAPEVLLGLLLYGYATGVFSSRKIERATYEAVPFRFIADNLHPDHDTLATFRRTFLPELKDLFVQVLLLAQEARPFHSGGKVLAC